MTQILHLKLGQSCKPMNMLERLLWSTVPAPQSRPRRVRKNVKRTWSDRNLNEMTSSNEREFLSVLILGRNREKTKGGCRSTQVSQLRKRWTFVCMSSASLFSAPHARRHDIAVRNVRKRTGRNTQRPAPVLPALQSKPTRRLLSCTTKPSKLY